MKTLATILIALCLGAGTGPLTNSVSLSFNVSLDPSTFGGLSTNDFKTNFLFQILSSPDVSAPIASWQVFTNIPLSSVAAAPGWTTNRFPTDSATRFYVGRTIGYDGRQGNFTSVGVSIPTLPPGLIAVGQ